MDDAHPSLIGVARLARPCAQAAWYFERKDTMGGTSHSDLEDSDLWDTQSWPKEWYVLGGALSCSNSQEVPPLGLLSQGIKVGNRPESSTKGVCYRKSTASRALKKSRTVGILKASTKNWGVCGQMHFCLCRYSKRAAWW